MRLIYIDDEPYKIHQLTKAVSISSLNRMNFIGKAGDYIMLDRWMNLTLVDEEAMTEFLAGTQTAAMDGGDIKGDS